MSCLIIMLLYSKVYLGWKAFLNFTLFLKNVSKSAKPFYIDHTFLHMENAFIYTPFCPGRPESKSIENDPIQEMTCGKEFV